MTEQNGPYRRHFFDSSKQCMHVEVTRVPQGWKPILNPRRSGATLVAGLAAVLAWITVAIRAVIVLAG